MNKVILLGYLSKDPELREFPDKDIKVAKISVAVSDERNYSKSYFFNCSAFSKTAEYIMNNLKKGDFVSIDGNLTNNSFINSEGKKITYTEIIIQSIRNLGRRAKDSDNDLSSSSKNNEENVLIDDYLIKSNIDDNQNNNTQDQQLDDLDNNDSDEDFEWDE